MLFADLHLHSKYSRAVSRDMVLPTMAEFAKKKGLGLLSTGDWTHPLWLREIKQTLEETGEGIYQLKNQNSEQGSDPKFILSVEISSIYSQGSKVRRIHSLLFAPNIETVEKFNQELIKRGANLTSDGRPIVGITPKNLLEILMGINEKSFLIPCHVWTPWFSLYGSMSGFDSIEECFGDFSKYIFAVETGLSSDPSMNWRIKELDSRSIVSFSDAHSPMKMGREATVFVAKNRESRIMNQGFNFDDIRLALKKDPKANLKIGFTAEFYPEEGKYHYTGHRNCKVIQSPNDSKQKGIICPVCSKPLTVGVMHRVEELSAREEKIKNKPNDKNLLWITDPSDTHPPYVKLVPLNEIIAETFDLSVASVKVKRAYEDMILNLGSEMDILLKVNTSEISRVFGEDIASAIGKVRAGEIYIKPGYDGEYGVVKIEKVIKKEDLKIEADLDSSSQDQLGLDF